MVANLDHGDVKATLTTFFHGAKDWWKSPRGTVFRNEFLVGVVAISMLFLAAFGSLRRRRRNFFAQKVVLASYLSISLVSYTLGSMQSSPVKSSMYPIWAISLCILAGSTNSITAYSLDDNSQHMRQVYDIFLCMFYALLIAATIFKNGVGILLFLDVIGLAMVKWMQRTWACITASRSWNLNKIVADYMHQEHTMSSSHDPASMKGYRYLVDWPLHKSKLEARTLYAAQVTSSTTTESDNAAAHEVIDIEKIWQCKSLSSDQKDICLSFSLFHLLRRRCFRFECGESSEPKTHDFVFKGLLAKKKKNNAAYGVAGEAEAGTVDYNWAFKLIEVELAFMYDFFFTKYAAIYYRPWAPALIGLGLICFAPALLAPVVAVSSTNGWRILDVNDRSTVATTTTADVVVTLLMFACIALLELLQLLFYWTTIWGRVYLACHSVRRQEATNTGSDLPFHIKIGVCISKSYLYWFPQKNKCYWQKELGQYSLLESVLYNPNPSKVLRTYMNLERAFNVANQDVIHPVNNLIVRWRVRKPRKPIAVELSAEVKEALVQCLERTQGDLTNGQSALLLNRASDLLWACRHDDLHPYSGTAGCSQKKENQAQFILTWHIATCYCERETLKNPATVVGEAFKHHIDVATQISKYCAYLVVNEPKLLPGHPYDTSRVFDAVALEAVGYLLSEKPARQPDSEEIFQKGVRPWEQLKTMEEGTCWKVLADFWVEMLLFVAPSDNVKEHIESLANGGELITHLWALLTHAGILDRGPRNIIDIENAGAHRHHPAPATNDHNHVQPGTFHQQANLQQNVKRTPGAHNAASEVEEIQ